MVRDLSEACRVHCQEIEVRTGPLLHPYNEELNKASLGTHGSSEISCTSVYKLGPRRRW